MLIIVALAPLSARAQDAPFILVDADTGAVLAENRSGELWYPASLTKLMTVYLVFEALEDERLQLDSPVTVSARALAEPPSKMGFPAGTVITVDNALKMLIVKSANDIAVAVAEMMAGSESAFIMQMNAAAQRLGLTGTNFINPHGLPGSGQSTTARDMAVLARTIWNDFPQYRELFAIGAISYGATLMPSANTLLEFYPGANGMKTGYICAAGFNLVGSATRSGRTLIVVVLGETTPLRRAERAALLLDRGFGGMVNVIAASVEAFTPRLPSAAPADMRGTVCPTPAPDAEVIASPEATPGPITAILGWPLIPQTPVPVFTGGADMDATIFVPVPVPRPRPPPLGAALDLMPG
ncbi:MAG: D-alanyl-D-alanine carboxypeptidase [Bauldia sp.]|nr:D-alanyl-D-alanine carboxypeptidase [Bauldia sp.]